MTNDYSVGSEFQEHRRNLPHWQEGGRSYFITFRSVIGGLKEEARAIVKHHILFDHTRRYELFFGVVMPDHVHLLLRPLQKANGSWFGLPEILRGIKGSSARTINRQMGRSGSVWQDEYYDRLIRDEKELHEKWLYMWNNPIKAGLCEGADEYPFYVMPEREHTAFRGSTD